MRSGESKTTKKKVDPMHADCRKELQKDEQSQMDGIFGGGVLLVAHEVKT